MKTISRAITLTLSAGIFMTLFVSKASAGCGDLSNWKGPFEFAKPTAETRAAEPSVEAAGPLIEVDKASLRSASIVGLWKVQFISKGNVSHNPSIPDGAVIDFGYSQWHSDGTEILNSGGHAPATENFCLGVYQQTAFLGFQLNHFPISYDATTGAIANYIEIRETVTLAPDGGSYSGPFTFDIYDTKGNHVDHLVGTATGSRLTVDSSLPSAAPSATN
jgi:hypothetical protein